MATNAEGRPVRVLLKGGQVHDVTQAPALVRGWEPSHMIAAKGYDSQAFVDGIQERGALAVIPSRSNRKHPRAYDTEVYKQRNLIERCFNKLKHFRRIATRYDRNAVYFPAFIYLAAASLGPGHATREVRCSACAPPKYAQTRGMISVALSRPVRQWLASHAPKAIPSDLARDV
jgi:transposase